MISALTFPHAGWWWVALVAATILAPLAWRALAPTASARDARTVAVGLALRTFGIGLLALCLLDPQWNARRAVRGANAFAVVADNSQGLQVTDAGADGTRGEQLRTQLGGAGDSWLADLADTFAVRPYVFDRELRRVRDFSALDFNGDRTALVAALRRLAETTNSGNRQPLAGVLLFTDGNATDLPDGPLDLSGVPPIYPVVVGAGGVRDVRIDRAIVRQTAFDDAPVTVQVDVAGHDAAGAEFRVQLRPLGLAGRDEIARRAPPAQTIRVPASGEPTPVTFTWNPGGSGVQFYEAVVESAADSNFREATTLNNRRVVMIDRGRATYRILYVSGRPNWEFKFLNRALADDPQLQMVGLVRVARREPKFEFRGRAGEESNPMFRGFAGEEAAEAPRYDQPVLVRLNARDETELRTGFPVTAEELFGYDAVILDDLEAGFFTHEQLALLRRFAAERGGGLLMLGGVDSLENGKYADSPLAAALPVYLDRPATQPPSGTLRWRLTREGWVEPWMRTRATEGDERTRLAAMPPLSVGNSLAAIKPGATVLAEVEDEAGHTFPALVAQHFGAGRVACVGVGDLWRWGLRGESDQADLARFWRQLSRWLVTDVPARVTVRIERAPDAAVGVRLRVTAREKTHQPVDVANARVTIRRLDAETRGDEDARAPGFSAVSLTAEPVPDAPGQFAASFPGRDAGAYFAEAEVTGATGEVIGRAGAGWVVDPAADEFRSLEPNRSLLEEIARRTGGEVVPWSALPRLISQLPHRRAPIEETWAYPIWDTAWVFLVVLACFVAEWSWRRWRGLP